MKIYCSCCDKVQPVRIDNCRDAKTNEPYQDIVCAECDLVIAAGTGIAPPASKPWVGLTDVEWMNIVNKDHAWFGQRPEDVAHEVAKLVEAKLREKNA